jgi:hypothetical protein
MCNKKIIIFIVCKYLTLYNKNWGAFKGAWGLKWLQSTYLKPY